MAHSQDQSSFIGKLFKTWLTVKAGKGALRMTTPLAIGGIGYYLYRKFKASSATI